MDIGQVCHLTSSCRLRHQGVHPFLAADSKPRHMYSTERQSFSRLLLQLAHLSRTLNMSTLTAPPGGDRNRATELNAVAWTWFSLSTVFVAARVYSRLKLTRNFWYNDHFIVLSWVRIDVTLLSMRPV